MKFGVKMFEAIWNFVTGADPIWQWLAVIAIGAIPYIESYGGALLGILAGVNPFIAVAAAIVGNLISMYIVVYISQTVRKSIVKDKKPSKRMQKLQNWMNKFGVPGVSLLGQLALPSQLTAVALIGLGAKTRIVLLWQTISIIIWGVLFGILAVFALDVIIYWFAR
jgi:membrane protein DedA with SNARE-associated domain